MRSKVEKIVNDAFLILRNDPEVNVGPIADDVLIAILDATKVQPRSRPDVTSGTTERIKTGCGSVYVTINHDEQGICEVFATIGKSGGCGSSQVEAIGRLVSLALRSGIDKDAVIKQLVGIKCSSPIHFNGEQVESCSDAVAKSLRNWGKNK